MFLGSEVTCPMCHQRDATMRVNMLVRQIDREMTPQQVDALHAAVQREDAREWRGEPKEASWNELAKQLRPPQKPELESIAKLSDSFIELPFIRQLVGIFIVASVFLFWRYDVQIININIPLVCIVWVGIVIGIWRLVVYVREPEKRLTPKIDTWSYQMNLWNSLFYCARDNVVFLPGKNQVAAPNELRQVLT